MIRLRCPGCQRPIQFGNDQAGKAVQCPECGKGFRLPQLKPKTTGVQASEPATAKNANAPAGAAPIPIKQDEWEDRSPYGIKQDPVPQKQEEEEDRVSELVRRSERLKARERALASVDKPGFYYKALATYCAIITVIAFLVLSGNAVLSAFKRQMYLNQAAEEQAKALKQGGAPALQKQRDWPLSITERIFGENTHYVVVQLILIAVTTVLLVLLGLVVTAAEKFRRFDSYNWVMIGTVTGTITGLAAAVMPGYLFYQVMSDSGGDVYEYLGKFLGLLLTLPFPLMGLASLLVLMLASRQDIKREFFWRPGQPITDMDEESDEDEEVEDEEEEEEDEE
ncbi:MAG: hypothetical protein RMJ19_01300 [Gemmatales bacterium]|nr:hypothetical protein [Gemmatales bacterium]MCS7159082.1 hypothetical protein [Gemmatales bacterium]MDW8174282.1 hypothetical protein [Gemmatales bacterium]MDW8221997.1 hypothetical protein [Gemmatales bacterium]